MSTRVRPRRQHTYGWLCDLPDRRDFLDRLRHRAPGRLPGTVDLREFCFVLGFSVYESYESQEVAQKGIAPFSGPDERVLGGYAVLAVGYDEPEARSLSTIHGEHAGDRPAIVQCCLRILKTAICQMISG